VDTDHLPVVHEHVGFPQLVGRDSEVLDPAILRLVPAQIVVVPLLHLYFVLVFIKIALVKSGFSIYVLLSNESTKNSNKNAT